MTSLRQGYGLASEIQTIAETMFKRQKCYSAFGHNQPNVAAVSTA